MFCKRCHKKIIKVVKNMHEARNKCVCGHGTPIYVATGELTWARNDALSKRESERYNSRK